MKASEWGGISTARSMTVVPEHLEADVVVIGSGAGGAVSAYELARAGQRVVILEAGPFVPSSEFTEQITDSLMRMYASGGGQMNDDGDLNILQGRCVGGSTVVNAAVAFRTPSPILQKWVQELGLAHLSPENLQPYFEELERNLSVHENGPHERNINARMMELGCDRLGIPYKPLARNIKDCALTGFCLAGCKTDRKQSMLVTYVPWALQHGARLYADTEAIAIRAEQGRVTTVVAEVKEQGRVRGVMQIHAPRVILAAGAIQSPLLLLKSNLANSSGQVGRNFACHPSFGIIARFKENLEAWNGALCGSYIDAFSGDQNGGFIIESGFGEPAFVANLSDTGIDQEHADYMLNARRMASAVVLLHDSNHGVVSWKGGKKSIAWQLHEGNRAGALRSLLELGRIYFAAGAVALYLPGLRKTEVHSLKELEKVLDDWRRMDALPLAYVAYHPQGTCRMGLDARHSVVGPYGESHDIKGLTVVDASILPTSILVNPQMTIYALAHLISDHLNGISPQSAPI